MDRAIVFIFLFTAVESLIVKTYHFIDLKQDWYNAQAHCRIHHTDLAFADNQHDHEEIFSFGGHKGWLGLFRDVKNATGWKWSGGGYITFESWKSGHPDNNGGNETMGLIDNREWVDKKSEDSHDFYCVTFTVMDHMKKPWEEALDLCRRNHTDLGSQLSPTARRLMQQRGVDRVWIALRYLSDSWLWVNGDAPQEQAWTTGADQNDQCPLKNRCGSLTMDGRWEAWDCRESLYFFCK